MIRGRMASDATWTYNTTKTDVKKLGKEGYNKYR